MRCAGVGVFAALLLTFGCTAHPLEASTSASSVAGPDCASFFVGALVAGDSRTMYDCSAGEFRHRIDERADMAGRSPTAELDRELAISGYTATRYSMHSRTPLRATSYQVANLASVAVFELQTDHGPMRIQVFLDPAGKVALVTAPQPDPRNA